MITSKDRQRLQDLAVDEENNGEQINDRLAVLARSILAILNSIEEEETRQQERRERN